MEPVVIRGLCRVTMRMVFIVRLLPIRVDVDLTLTGEAHLAVLYTFKS